MTRGILRHPVMKLVSSGLAIGLWFFVHGEQQVEVSVHVPVKLVNMSANFVLTEEVERTVLVRIAGPRTRVRRVRDRPPSAVELSLDGLKTAGIHSFRMEDERFDFPRGTRILRIEPSLLRVHVEQAVKRMVRVEPQLFGDPPKGFRVSSVEVRPQWLEARGPRSHLARLAFVPTEPIDLQGKTASFEGSFAVHMSGPGWEFLPSQVTVRVNLARRASARR